MTPNDQQKGTHEVQFIRAFVIPARQDRFLEFINSKRGRSKFTRELDHNYTNVISQEFLTHIPKAQRTPGGIAQLLRSKNAPETCHIISSNHELDSTERPLSLALEKTVGRGFGTVVSCIPGKLAYFEAEDPGERFILEN